MTDAYTSGREPVQIFELKQPSCSNEFGVAPCTATGSTKCFNTRSTCQDAENYNQDANIFWRFSHAIDAIQLDDATDNKTPAIPSLKSVSTSPTVINAGGGSDDISVLGVRSSITVQLTDMPHDDTFADKYLSSRNYNPLERGTFWGKFRARNPYIYKAECAVYNGYLGQTLDEMTKRTFVIDKVNPPDSSGNVTVTAKDPLKLAGDKLAQIPAVSDLQLVNDIDETQTTGIILTGTEADVSAELGTTGTTRYLTLGDEIISYTGYTVASNQFTLTGVTRGVLNTVAEEQDAEDSAQRAVRYEQLESWKIARDAILNYSSVPSEYIDSAAWDAEGDVWLNSYDFTGTIVEPTAVVDIVAELGQQSLFYIWWNEKTQLIDMRALRPVSELVRGVNADVNIVGNSVSLTEKPSQRISRVAIYYNRKDPTQDEDDFTNYSSVRININGEAESEFLYNESSTKTIYSRWIRTDIQAIQVATRLLSAFTETPKYLNFSVDAKDGDINVADVLNVTIDQLQDQFGSTTSELFQVISLDESEYSHRIDLKLRQFTFQITNAGFWTESDQVNYDQASEADKITGNMWWSDEDGLMPNGDNGYNWS